MCVHDYYKYRERAAAYEWYRTSVRIGLSEVCVVCQCVSACACDAGGVQVSDSAAASISFTVAIADSVRKTERSAIGSEQTSILDPASSELRRPAGNSTHIAQTHSHSSQYCTRPPSLSALAARTIKQFQKLETVLISHSPTTSSRLSARDQSDPLNQASASDRVCVHLPWLTVSTSFAHVSREWRRIHQPRNR